MPVLMPGPTTSAGAPVRALKNFCSPNTAGGTTDEMMPAVIARHASPSMSSSVFSSTAYSSDVRAATVWMRQCAASSPFSRNTPSTVFVFPTSTASNAVIAVDGSSPQMTVVGSVPPMRALSKIFVLATIVLGACGGGNEDTRPGPLATRIEMMHIAAIDPAQQTGVLAMQNDWNRAQAENAKAQADYEAITSQLTVVRNDREKAKLQVSSAVSNKNAAAASNDTNQINAAEKEVRTAELGVKAADARIRYYEAYRAYLLRHWRYTEENMYWREAQFELAK